MVTNKHVLKVNETNWKLTNTERINNNCKNNNQIVSAMWRTISNPQIKKEFLYNLENIKLKDSNK